MKLTLHTTEHPMLFKHEPLKCKGCYPPDSCNICAGLTICAVCGGAEGSLLDSCPGVKLTREQDEWNYMGEGYRMHARQRREAR